MLVILPIEVTKSHQNEIHNSFFLQGSKKPVNKQTSKAGNSDSEAEARDNAATTPTKKLTRSANTRKSKHIVGKTAYSDTDSDTESTKRSLSRSPVKRAPITAKGKTKNKKNDVKTKINDIVILEERKCPLEECNSLGHLGGKFEKHFTIDACPNYHNITISTCKEEVSFR